MRRRGSANTYSTPQLEVGTQVAAACTVTVSILIALSALACHARIVTRGGEAGRRGDRAHHFHESCT
jgi:hypothetical protein